MSKYFLFLDDIRLIDDVKGLKWPGPWEIAKNYNEFVSAIQVLGVPVGVTFDHDLGLSISEASCDQAYKKIGFLISRSKEIDGEKTGLDCAKWLVEYCHQNNVEFPVWNIHSANPIGSENIRLYIKSAIRSGYIRARRFW